MQGQTVLANVILKKNGGTTIVASTVFDYLPESGRALPSTRLELTKRENGQAFEASLSFFNFWDDGAGPGPHTQWDNPAVPDSGPCTPTCTANLDAKAGGKDYILTAAYSTPLDGGKFRINALLEGQNYLDRESDTGTPSAFDDLTRYTQDVYKGELGAHYVKDLSQSLNMELVALEQAQRQLVVSDYTQGDFDHFREGDTLGETILRGVLHWRAMKSLTIDSSIEGAYNIQTTQTNYDVDQVPQNLVSADVRVIERRTEANVSATWTPDPHYTLETGMKVEASNLTSSGDTVLDKTLVYPKPRVVFTWSPDPNDQVRIRGEREVGQLDFSSFIATAALNTTQDVHAGNPNLLPQDAWVAEIALERKFWTSGDLTVTLRRQDINDAVDRVLDPSGLFDEPGNIGHATENDLVVDFTAPLDRLFVKNGLFKADATWRDTRATDPTTHQERPLSQVHPLDWRVSFTQDLPTLKSTWGVSIQGGFTQSFYRYDEIDQYKLGDTLQLSYEYKPTRKLALRLELNNLTSRPYEQAYNVYADARPAPLEYIDWRSERSGPEIHLRLRNTFS
jgi:outer membrane receptor protein involved in Fe transport